MSRVAVDIPDGWPGGIWLYRSDTAIRQTRPHHHAEIEVNLVRRGKGVYLINDERVPITRSALIWLFPDQSHYLIRESANFEMWVVVFSQKVYSHALSLLQRKKSDGIVPEYRFFLLNVEASLQAEAMTAAAMKHMANPKLLELSLTNLLVEMGMLSLDVTPQKGIKSTNIHPAVFQAIQRIDASVEDASLDALSAEVGLSRSRLSEQFHADVGITITSFRNRRRLLRFLESRASSPHLTLLEHALRAGFGSYAQFYRIFTEQFHDNPRHWLATHYASGDGITSELGAANLSAVDPE